MFLFFFSNFLILAVCASVLHVALGFHLPFFAFHNYSFAWVASHVDPDFHLPFGSWHIYSSDWGVFVFAREFHLLSDVLHTISFGSNAFVFALVFHCFFCVSSILSTFLSCCIKTIHSHSGVHSTLYGDWASFHVLPIRLPSKKSKNHTVISRILEFYIVWVLGRSCQHFWPICN